MWKLSMQIMWDIMEDVIEGLHCIAHTGPCMKSVLAYSVWINIMVGNNEVLGKRNFLDINRELGNFEHTLLHTNSSPMKISQKWKEPPNEDTYCASTTTVKNLLKLAKIMIFSTFRKRGVQLSKTAKIKPKQIECSVFSTGSIRANINLHAVSILWVNISKE